MKLILCLLTLVMMQSTQPSYTPADARALADQVMKASGSDVWPKVTRIKFNFGGRASHDWDLRKGTDTVTFNDKTVTIDLNKVGDDPDSKAAFQRWTNDTYWLLMPLKLHDGGLILERKPDETRDGKTWNVLHMSFQSVGLTPGDQYNLYIDPETHQVRSWDYMPKPDAVNHHTWDGYQNFNGLVLSTEHDMGGGKKLIMSDIDVELAK